jgi:hypothetical protein
MVAMRIVNALAAAAALLFALSSCSSSPSAPGDTLAAPEAAASTDAASILATYGLAGLDGRAVVDRLDRAPVSERPAQLRASVRPGQLLLSDGSSDDPAVLDLPKDEFYLSVAPYADQTHDCFHHSLTTCRGELAGEPLQVTITEQGTGAVLVDTSAETYDNGFIGFWLPAGIDATIRIVHGGRSGTADISTGPDDPTCLTTLALV